MPDHRPGRSAPALPRPGLDAIGAELAARLPLEDLRPPAMSTSFDLGDELPLQARIAVALAVMEERQKAIQDQHRSDSAAAEARHGQIVSMLATFVPRAEIEANQAAINGRFSALERRLSGIEGRTWKVVAWVLGTIGTTIAGAFGVHFHRGG